MAQENEVIQTLKKEILKALRHSETQETYLLYGTYPNSEEEEKAGSQVTGYTLLKHFYVFGQQIVQTFYIYIYTK